MLSCNLRFVDVVAIVAVLNLLTDVAQIVVVEDWGDVYFLVGFIVFAISQFWRLGWEGWFLLPALHTLVAQAHHRCPAFLYMPLLWVVFVAAGTVKLVVRFIRILLIPFDVFTRLACDIVLLEDDKWLCVVRSLEAPVTEHDNGDPFHLATGGDDHDDDDLHKPIKPVDETADQSDEYSDDVSDESKTAWPWNYAQEIGAFLGGLRHFAMRVAEDVSVVDPQVVDKVTRMALVEQFLQNAGGILMALATILDENVLEVFKDGSQGELPKETSVVALLAITLSSFSVVLETWHLASNVFEAYSVAGSIMEGGSTDEDFSKDDESKDQESKDTDSKDRELVDVEEAAAKDDDEAESEEPSKNVLDHVKDHMDNMTSSIADHVDKVKTNMADGVDKVKGDVHDWFQNVVSSVTNKDDKKDDEEGDADDDDKVKDDKENIEDDDTPKSEAVDVVC